MLPAIQPYPAAANPFRMFKPAKGSAEIDLKIRQARSEDVADICGMIVAAVRESNSQDYSASIIDSAVAHFTPERVSELLE